MYTNTCTTCEAPVSAFNNNAKRTMVDTDMTIPTGRGGMLNNFAFTASVNSFHRVGALVLSSHYQRDHVNCAV